MLTLSDVLPPRSFKMQGQRLGDWTFVARIAADIIAVSAATSPTSTNCPNFLVTKDFRADHAGNRPQ